MLPIYVRGSLLSGRDVVGKGELPHEWTETCIP
jgi:hypothetical protein